jgi:2-C-methyl-D-erythritol 4-phosphate cytidylyltransferase
VTKIGVIIAAAGSSRRFQDRHTKKPFAMLNNRSVWLFSTEKFLQQKEVVQVLVVIAPEDREMFLSRFASNLAFLEVTLVEGGAERADSIENAVSHLREEVDLVAVHDAARPCLSEIWIEQVFDAAKKHGAAMLATPVVGTLKRVDAQHVIQETVARDNLWEAQTPQVFRRDWFEEAYKKREGFAATDDAQLVERAGHPVRIVPCDRRNLKITTKTDLKLAEKMLALLPKPKLEGPHHPFAGDDFWR